MNLHIRVYYGTDRVVVVVSVHDPVVGAELVDEPLADGWDRVKDHDQLVVFILIRHCCATECP